MPDFLFKEEFINLVMEMSIEDPPIMETEFDDMWQMLLGINKDKRVFGNTNTETVQLAQMYIIEYYNFAMSVGDKDDYNELQMLLKALLLDIANTAMAIYKLAFDGLNYQANVLLRNFYELCMIFLNIIIDKTKRKALFESAKNEDGRQIWYKYFKPNKLQQALKEYEDRLGGGWSDGWHRRTYGHLSSYAHNDFLSFFLGAYAVSENAEEAMLLNVCGNSADRVDALLDDMNTILFYTGMHFFKMIVDPRLDVRKEYICADNTEDSDHNEFWNQAAFLELLNRKCYLKLYFSLHHEYDDK